MKVINIVLVGICLLSLSACDTLDNWNSGYLSGTGDYLRNEQGMVGDCKGSPLSVKSWTIAGADIFWEDNNLPKGTTNYMCKDGKAYLLNKVTNCQGEVIANQPGGIMKFRKDHGFPDGYSYIAFTCVNGNVKPIMWS